MKSAQPIGQTAAASWNLRLARNTVRAIYRKLSRAWGPQHWWPAETPFEVMVGAILTQNTSWTNVERAMVKLREAGALSVEGIRGLPLSELEQLVRSSGYFRQKAQRLKDFVAFLDEKYGGSLDAMLATPTAAIARRVAGAERHRPGDGGFDSALRGTPSDFRR